MARTVGNRYEIHAQHMYDVPKETKNATSS
jgi:hypothetical protein